MALIFLKNIFRLATLIENHLINIELEHMKTFSLYLPLRIHIQLNNFWLLQMYLLKSVTKIKHSMNVLDQNTRDSTALPTHSYFLSRIFDTNFVCVFHRQILNNTIPIMLWF